MRRENEEEGRGEKKGKEDESKVARRDEIREIGRREG